MSQSPGNGSEEISDKGSEGSHPAAELIFPSEHSIPSLSTSLPGNPTEVEANADESRRQLRQILERKKNRGSDPSDPRNADTLELQFEASEAESRKDLSWSALLNPGMNQSLLRDEPAEPLVKEQPKPKPSPKTVARQQAAKTAPEAQKPASKPASVKSDTPKRKEAPRKQSFTTARDVKEESKGGASSRSSRRDSEARRSEDFGCSSERGSSHSLIAQLARKDREKRTGKTPDSMKAVKGSRTYTEASDDSVGLVANPEIVPGITNLRLPEVPRLELGSLGGVPLSGGPPSEPVQKAETRPRSKSGSKSPGQAVSHSPKVSQDSNRPQSREKQPSPKVSPDANRPKSREREPSPKVSPDANRPKSREREPSPKVSPDANRPKSREREPSPKVSPEANRPKSHEREPSPKVSPDSNPPQSREKEHSPPSVKKPASKPPLSPKLQFDTESGDFPLDSSQPDIVIAETIRIDDLVPRQEERQKADMKETGMQTDDGYNQKLQQMMEVLSDPKVLKGLKFVGGFARYLQSVGFQA